MKKFIAHMVEQETGVPDNSDLYKKFDENLKEFERLKLINSRNWGSFENPDDQKKFNQTVENIGDILTDKNLSNEDYSHLMNKKYNDLEHAEEENSNLKPIHEHFGWTLFGVPLERGRQFLKSIPYEQKMKYVAENDGRVLKEHYKMLLRHPEQTEKDIIETLRDAHELGNFVSNWGLAPHVLGSNVYSDNHHIERMLQKRGMDIRQLNKVYPGKDSEAVMNELRRLKEHGFIGTIFKNFPFRTKYEEARFYDAGFRYEDD